MNGGLGFSPYAASKFAVVGMSEGLATQLKPLGIGVSVLCPGYVRTGIGESGRNRPQRYGNDADARIRQARRASWSPRSPSACRRGSTRRRSRRGFSPRSARTNSTCSPIRKCASEVDERFAAIQAAMDKVTALNIVIRTAVRRRIALFLSR